MANPFDQFDAKPVKPVRAPKGNAFDQFDAPKRTWMDEVTGAMANVNRGLGIGDEIAAAANTGLNLLQGKIGLNQVGQDFARQRQFEDDFAAQRPKVAAFARGTGNAATAVVPAGGSAQLLAAAPRVMNVARGAVTAGLTGAAYAAADRGTATERLGAASSAATNPVVLGLGAALGAAGPARGPIKAPTPKPQSDAQTLAQIGVTTSIPQRLGGPAKQLEDLGMRAPILGPAIRGARDREVQQLNRGVALRALQPIGASLPKTVKPGFETVQYVDDALSKVYDDAARPVPAGAVEPQIGGFLSDLSAIQARSADLADGEAQQFAKIVEGRLARLANPNADGAMVKKIHSELGGLQSEAAKRGQDTLASMLGDTRRALMGIVERANPQAGAMIRKADEGWGIYSIMNDAAASASNRGGVFLPGQLNTQVRAAGRRIGSNMTGKGQAPLQDIATAATKMIPDQFGNPGTADTLGLGALGSTMVLKPEVGIPAAAGLGAASTPYFLMGRKVIEELPPSATSAQLQEAARVLQELATKDPAVAGLYRQVAARLGTAGAVAGASATPTLGVSSQ